MASRQIHYVYEWVRPDIDMVFYVGKGSGNRAYSKRRYKHTNNVMSYLSNNGLTHEVRILANFATKDAAFEFEIERIAFWKPLGELTNKTPGGESGPSLPGESNPFYGRKHSPESIAKISAALTGKPCPMKGKKHKPESIEKMSAKAKGRPGNRGTTGMKFSEETCAKMSAAHTGVPKSKEHAKNARDAVWGKDYVPMTAEQKKDRYNAARRERRRAKRLAESAV